MDAWTLTKEFDGERRRLLSADLDALGNELETPNGPEYSTSEIESEFLRRIGGLGNIGGYVDCLVAREQRLIARDRRRGKGRRW